MLKFCFFTFSGRNFGQSLVGMIYVHPFLVFSNKAHLIFSLRLSHEALSALEIPNDLLQVIQDLLQDLRVHCLLTTLQHTEEGKTIHWAFVNVLLSFQANNGKWDFWEVLQNIWLKWLADKVIGQHWSSQDGLAEISVCHLCWLL